MNDPTKMRKVMELFRKSGMTQEQYEQFRLLAKELQLTVADITEYEAMERQLSSDAAEAPHYIN